ncbi:MAG TPA: 3'(2'),5'-bisphosphate nucleotidase CysQ [Micavibrio sp.]
MLSASSQKLLAHPLALCNILRRMAVAAGDITLQYFDESGMDESQYQQKPDGSPVTRADIEAEAFIIDELKKILPDVPVVGEEAFGRGEIPELTGHDYFFLIDALDGTKQFKQGDPHYTVNIALIHKGEPVIGVICAPAQGELYAGSGPGTAIRWLADKDTEKSIHVRRPPHGGLTVVASQEHGKGQKMEDFLQQHKVAKRLSLGSSLKLCFIAAGKADLYPRFGQTSEWDTAAGDAILRAAGGVITDLQGQPLTYGKAGAQFCNPEFIARAYDLAL